MCRVGYVIIWGFLVCVVAHATTPGISNFGRQSPDPHRRATHHAGWAERSMRGRLELLRAECVVSTDDMTRSSCGVAVMAVLVSFLPSVVSNVAIIGNSHHPHLRTQLFSSPLSERRRYQSTADLFSSELGAHTKISLVV